MRIAIIGAGMAGLACATELRRQGHDPLLFDKARGPGGRMSTRRMATPLGGVSFDHGAQYLTARDPDFVAQVQDWAKEGHVARWPAAGPDAWVGTPAMNAPIRAMAADADVTWNSRIEALSHDGRWHLHGDGIDAGTFDAVMLAVPAEQVSHLIEPHDPHMAEQARSIHSDPCWTVMATFADRLPIAEDRLTDRGLLASAIRNSAKPGRSGPEAWVLQATADWSRDHLEDDPAIVLQAILAAFAAEADAPLPAPVATGIHRWRYAKSRTLGGDALWNADRRLGLCGDWLIAPRIEAAWLSGRRLAALIG